MICHEAENYIIVELLDNRFLDLFNDLILSFYHQLKNINDDHKSAQEFIHAFFKWSEFFDDKASERLSREVIKGLFGELLVLESLIETSSESNINEVLDAWKGPYDTAHDFVLDKKNIEVKTKYMEKLDVRISSEFQLQKELDKTLELHVVSIEIDFIGGKSIKELVWKLRTDINLLSGDFSILLKALFQKGITMQNIEMYDNFKFNPVNRTVYDCSHPAFPKIIKSELNEAISKVTYLLRISALGEYIISKSEY